MIEFLVRVPLVCIYIVFVNNMLSIENYIITNRISKYLCQTNEFLRREWGV